MTITAALDPRARDLAGQVFGRLTAMHPTSHRLNTYVVWECVCECGTLITVSARYLTNRKVRSCGCTQEPRAHIEGREYSIWTDMRNRCRNPNNKRFNRYGARGITVCERWNDFATFLADMGPCPEGHTLDRINNDGHYEPSNCRWATYHQQVRNNSRNRRLTLNGRTMCLIDWSIETGLSSDVIYARIRLGWSTQRALTEPLHDNAKKRG